MDAIVRKTILVGVIFLISGPILASAQGVESDATGVEDLMPELKTAEKKAASGWLGVMLETPDEESGVDVVRVIRASPAEKGGLQKGDRLLRIEGQAVGSAKDVQTIVAAQTLGDEAKIEFRRGEQSQTISVTIAASPSTEQLLKGQFVGHAAPQLSAEVVGQETTVELEKLAGKPVVLDFWATWCGPCRPMSQKLAKISERVGDRAHFVGVTSESQKTVQRHLANNPHGFRVATADEAVIHAYLVESYPTVFVLDSEGKVAGVFVGLGHGDAIDKLVDKLIAEAE